MKVYWLLALGLVACTKRNPAVCCLTEADCKAADLGGIRECAPGLACVDHECVVPSCSMMGCQAATPVCNITTDVCEGCTQSSQCSRFDSTDVCNTVNGSCVECVDATDCDATRPVCDTNVCRVCTRDADCPSAACGDDGACVPESAIVYMDPSGTDSGMCTRAAPCRGLEYAAMRTSVARPHIVFNPGGYVQDHTVVDSLVTSAPHLFIHGGGASISMPPGNDGSLFSVNMNATIRDLELFTDSAMGLGGNAHSVLGERLTIHGFVGAVTSAGTLVLRDVRIKGGTWAVQPSGGSLTLERVTISGGGYGIYSLNSNIMVNVVSTLIYDMSERAIELPYAYGSIVSSTIADSGTNSGDGPRAVRCSSGMTIRSSIIWAPGSAQRVPVEGCNLMTTIAGPTSAPGAMNVNPQFVDSVNRDYHITASSPARDGADSGPESDFEGDPRPRGARFDIGADETE